MVSIANNGYMVCSCLLIKKRA
uniref:Uncharacterized protein n=1 Tax=Arundo donax TaxID=35708 RepID=A0A0A9F426_ARUDO